LGLNDVLNNIALWLENQSQLQKGEFRLGKLNLESLTEIQPLNQMYEALLIRCENCGKATAFLSLKNIDHFIDDEKQSKLQCRHCQFEMQIPKAQEIREAQGNDFDFLQLQSWTFTKILIKRGRILHFSISEAMIKFEYEENSQSKTIQIEVPQSKLKLLRNLQIGEFCRLKIKVYISKRVNPQKAFIKKPNQGSETIQLQKYELLSFAKVK
jgi:hypothetical protein